jgi:hypothetical protein
MTKTLILSLLLVFVYQFDELVRGLRVVVWKLMRKNYHGLGRDTDHYVGTALTIGLMPLLLNYALTAEGDLGPKLLFLFITYSVFALLMFGAGRFLRELGKARQYHGFNMAMSTASLVGGLFHPGLRYVPWDTGRERLTYAKLALLLSIPPLLGLIFRSVYDANTFEGEVSKYFDALIVVMIGGLFINIVIHGLERYFKRTNISMMGLFRIVVGVGVAFFLIM